jgi:hypothetical protein
MRKKENVEIVKQKKKSYNITEHLCDSKKQTISGILVDVFYLIWWEMSVDILYN